MKIDYRYTRHQVARGARPDAEAFNKYFLFKNTSQLHATYQIKLLLFLAMQNGKKLIIRVPKHCKTGASLRSLLNLNRKTIELEKI